MIDGERVKLGRRRDWKDRWRESERDGEKGRRGE